MVTTGTSRLLATRQLSANSTPTTHVPLHIMRHLGATYQIAKTISTCPKGFALCSLKCDIASQIVWIVRQSQIRNISSPTISFNQIKCISSPTISVIQPAQGHLIHAIPSLPPRPLPIARRPHSYLQRRNACIASAAGRVCSISM
jgi:hypothetical protein